MSYSKRTDGAQDARALAAVLARIGYELRKQDGFLKISPADVKPDGALIGAGTCVPALPSRTKAGRLAAVQEPRPGIFSAGPASVGVSAAAGFGSFLVSGPAA